MTLKSAFLSLCAVGLLAGCGEGGGGQVGENKSIDYGFGRKHLSQLQAGIWVDPNGCDHWIIDDGIEGYLSQRLDRNGKPVCSGVAPPTTVTGPFQGRQTVGDTF
ncbi:MULTISPECIES: hypothetical protein [unclassified Roseovarius]|uniref:hypothetical protein n=1 Tax=unclassified Roseovarius TaxID=2614913 RepID=UPI00273E32C2|nr:MULTISPECIES: hypothetical protein [unclassified Roseovarius]